MVRLACPRSLKAPLRRGRASFIKHIAFISQRTSCSPLMSLNTIFLTKCTSSDAYFCSCLSDRPDPSYSGLALILYAFSGGFFSQMRILCQLTLKAKRNRSRYRHATRISTRGRTWLKEAPTPSPSSVKASVETKRSTEGFRKWCSRQYIYWSVLINWESPEFEFWSSSILIVGRTRSNEWLQGCGKNRHDALEELSLQRISPLYRAVRLRRVPCLV